MPNTNHFNQHRFQVHVGLFRLSQWTNWNEMTSLFRPCLMYKLLTVPLNEGYWYFTTSDTEMMMMENLCIQLINCHAVTKTDAAPYPGEMWRWVWFGHIVAVEKYRLVVCNRKQQLQTSPWQMNLNNKTNTSWSQKVRWILNSQGFTTF